MINNVVNIMFFFIRGEKVGEDNIDWEFVDLF